MSGFWDKIKGKAAQYQASRAEERRRFENPTQEDIRQERSRADFLRARGQRIEIERKYNPSMLDKLASFDTGRAMGLTPSSQRRSIRRARPRRYDYAPRRRRTAPRRNSPRLSRNAGDNLGAVSRYMGF